ncbi:hypothetical protein CPB83DRAFT_856076 [Crepidotus variabilis]|uniref:Uncharacterized protein n=1 Tax=Crepidotus variabilis TaxID=179855 RepID=A0A9P6EDT3_9AGAR|nr:hypothetical protein CPB83DRAFT_856076 [Crepidotus variabilis]
MFTLLVIFRTESVCGTIDCILNFILFVIFEGLVIPQPVFNRGPVLSMHHSSQKVESRAFGDTKQDQF